MHQPSSTLASSSSSSSSRAPPPPRLTIENSTSFVFTSSRYDDAAPPPFRHSRHASLSNKLRKEHASGAFDARLSPDTLIPPGFVQLSGAAAGTQIVQKKVASDPTPSSSRPLWLPRITAVSRYPPDALFTTSSDSPFHENDSYFPPAYSAERCLSTSSTSPISSPGASPICAAATPPPPARRTNEGSHQDLSLTELMNGTNHLGRPRAATDARDKAGPRYQTLARPPRPSALKAQPKVLKDKPYRSLGLKHTSYSMDDGTAVGTDFEPVTKLKSDLYYLSLATSTVPEVVSDPDTFSKPSNTPADPAIAPQPPPNRSAVQDV